MQALSRALAGALTLLALVIALPAAAQERSGRRPGFTLAPGSATIVLIRPSIRVGAQSTGGMFEPNAEWTDAARTNLGAAIAEIQGRLGNRVVDYAEPAGGEGLRRIVEYRALFTTVAEAVIEYQFFAGNRLPTKKRGDGFDWSLGPDIGKVPGLEGADYALFVVTEDAYGSTGRKVAQVFAALVFGATVKSGVHRGHAGLVDLRTGDLVWLNADRQMGGDVRTRDGARKRVDQLFEDFPGRPPAPAASGGARR